MKIDRRTFLKAAVALGGSALASQPSDGRAMENFAGWEDRYGMLTDTTRCVGCRSCEAACNKANGLPPPDVPFDDSSVFEEERRTSSTAYTVVNRYDVDEENGPVFRKVQCNHCNEPACASACPVGAYRKTPEGAVTYNEDVCIGCRYCMVACPFYVPAYSYESAFEPAIVKCQLCYQDRLSKGIPPACAEACPMGAITFGRRKEILRVARERIRRYPDRYLDHIYGEHEAGGTSWLYLSAVGFDKIGFQTDLPERPFAELTYGFLSAVPLVFVIWPAMLGGAHVFSKYRNGEDDGSGAESTDYEI
jgi:Fe-S-cluster-containing dehydrogenase component